MTRNEKIALLKDIQEGKADPKTIFRKEPDLTKLTDQELRRLEGIQKNKGSVLELTSEDISFLESLETYLTNRPSGYLITK
jgi:hypothetical protein